MAWLQGYKTYILSGFGVLYIIGGLIGLWNIDETVVTGLGLGSIFTLRLALSRKI